MAHGFEEDKTKADLDDAIESAIAPLRQQIAELQAQLGNTPSVLYPVGSIYISTSSKDPGFTFGGRWESYAGGRMLLGITPKVSNLNPGDTGGASKQTINIDYKHSHDVLYTDTGDKVYAHCNVNLSSATHKYVLNPEIPETSAEIEMGKMQLLPVSSVQHEYKTDVKGTTTDATKTINTMPPYIAVYMWRRVE